MIKVYSTPTCGYCKTLKKMLTEKGIVFEDIDVSKDEEAMSLLFDKNYLSVPVTEKDGEFVAGFDVAALSKLLGVEL